MKIIVFCFFLFFQSITTHAQAYLGIVTKPVNLRAGEGTEFDIIKTLKKDDKLFIFSIEEDNEFYHVLDIASNREGFVSKKLVRIEKALPRSEQGLFSPSGTSSQYDPEVEVFNNTTRTLTLRLNAEHYTFRPREKKTITLSPAKYNFIASAPDVIPHYGTEELEGNTSYTWQFYIVTRRR